MRRRAGFPWTLSATLLLSAGGFAFWMLVARRLGGEAVGAGASLFSVAFFLVYATNLGLPVLVTRYALDRGERSVAITAVALIFTAVSGAVGAVAFVAVSPVDILEPLGGRTVLAVALMVIIVMSISISTIVDARLIASSRFPAYFLRVAAVTVLRLAGVALIPAADDGFVLFLVSVWAFGATSIVMLPSVLRSVGGFRIDHHVLLAERRHLVRFSTSNYAGQLALQGPVFLTPLLVLISVAALEFSRFYLAWGVTSVLLMVSQILSQTLLAEASNRGRSDQRTLVATTLGVGFAVGASLAAVAVGPWLAASLYGEQYRKVGDLLPWLLLGCGPAAVVAVVVSEARYAERNRGVLLTSMPFALLVSMAVAVGARLGGAEGASVGWLVGNLASLVPSGVQMTQLRRSPQSIVSVT